MSKQLRIQAAMAAIVATAMLSPGLTHAQSSTVVFQGLEHTAVGAAVLHVDTSRNALEVSGLGPSGADGVVVKAAGATSWTARVRIDALSGVPLRLAWSALADGRAIGSGVLRQVGDRLEMTPIFTGATTRPTHSVQVYNNGKLVGASGGLQPSSGGAVVPWALCLTVPEFCEFTAEFHTLGDGACMVKIVTPAAGPIRLPNGLTLIGNELRLVEEVRPASHYPYLGFDAMTVLGDARSLDILAESVR